MRPDEERQATRDEVYRRSVKAGEWLDQFTTVRTENSLNRLPKCVERNQIMAEEQTMEPVPNDAGNNKETYCGDGGGPDSQGIEEPTAAEEMQAPATEELTPEQAEGKNILEALKDEAPATDEEIMAPVTFKDACFGIRSDIELIKKKVWNMIAHPGHCEISTADGRCEASDNIMLAYRHLEDSRMRIGKVLQAYDGGVSILDK